MSGMTPHGTVRGPFSARGVVFVEKLSVRSPIPPLADETGASRFIHHGVESTGGAEMAVGVR